MPTALAPGLQQPFPNSPGGQGGGGAPAGVPGGQQRSSNPALGMQSAIPQTNTYPKQPISIEQARAIGGLTPKIHDQLDQAGVFHWSQPSGGAYGNSGSQGMAGIPGGGSSSAYSDWEIDPATGQPVRKGAFGPRGATMQPSGAAGVSAATPESQTQPPFANAWDVSPQGRMQSLAGVPRSPGESGITRSPSAAQNPTAFRPTGFVNSNPLPPVKGTPYTMPQAARNNLRMYDPIISDALGQPGEFVQSANTFAANALDPVRRDIANVVRRAPQSPIRPVGLPSPAEPIEAAKAAADDARWHANPYGNGWNPMAGTRMGQLAAQGDPNYQYARTASGVLPAQGSSLPYDAQLIENMANSNAPFKPGPSPAQIAQPNVGVPSTYRAPAGGLVDRMGSNPGAAGNPGGVGLAGVPGAAAQAVPTAQDQNRALGKILLDNPNLKLEKTSSGSYRVAPRDPSTMKFGYQDAQGNRLEGTAEQSRNATLDNANNRWREDQARRDRGMAASHFNTPAAFDRFASRLPPGDPRVAQLQNTINDAQQQHILNSLPPRERAMAVVGLEGIPGALGGRGVNIQGRGGKTDLGDPMQQRLAMTSMILQEDARNVGKPGYKPKTFDQAVTEADKFMAGQHPAEQSMVPLNQYGQVNAPAGVPKPSPDASSKPAPMDYATASAAIHPDFKDQWDAAIKSNDTASLYRIWKLSGQDPAKLEPLAKILQPKASANNPSGSSLYDPNGLLGWMFGVTDKQRQAREAAAAGGADASKPTVHIPRIVPR